MSLCFAISSCQSKSDKDNRNSDSISNSVETEEESENSEIREVVNKWNKSLNLRDEKLSMEVYAPEVVFYSQRMTSKECSEKRIDLATSDPTWQQEIISDISLDYLDNNTVQASFTKQSNSKKGTHTYPAYLVLKKIDGKWLITKESDKLTDKNIAKKKSIKVPNNAVRGDFDGDGKIDNVWIDPKYDSDGYIIGKAYLKSDNPKLEGLSWNATRDVILLNVGDLNNSNRDFLGAIPCYDSTWTEYKTYGFKNDKWKEAVPSFSVWIGNENIDRIWKSSRKGFVIISYNDMSDPDNGFDNQTKEVKMTF